MKTHKEKIDRIIKLKRDNTLWNHILTSLFHKGKTIAEKNGDNYVIWTSNLWTGGFYPIFKIDFNQNREISNIETELSLYGKLCLILLIVVITSFTTMILIIPMIENYREVNSYFLIPIILYSLLLYGFYAVMRMIYNREKKYLIEDLKVIIGVETQENIENKELKKDEWTLSKIILRVFLYPFTIFITIMSVYMILKGDLRGVFGILVGVGYLYADIRTIQQKRKKTKANTS